MELILTPASLLLATLICVLTTYAFFKLRSQRQHPVYLLDFALFKPSFVFRVPNGAAIEYMHHLLPPNSASFIEQIIERSGVGEETGLPHCAHSLPPDPTLQGSHEEAELVIFTAVEEVLRKTGMDVADVTVLIVNVNSFYPVPSLTSKVVNRYKLRSDIRSFNLSGMGCSCGPISVALAKDLMKGHPNSVALIVSSEIITANPWYLGNVRSMLIPNCLFRLGAAAIILSNRPQDRPLAKYKLLHTIRTHIGAIDGAYGCLCQEEDPEGILGITLSKDVMPLSGVALRDNLKVLGPFVLPYREQLLYLWSHLAKWKVPYIPNFGRVFDHICIHAGGRAVIDAVQSNLGLTDEQVEASRMTLYRFGNTSSSSVWYVFGYVEAKGRVKKGQKVWQLGLGSGFKCNSAVWECLRDVEKGGVGAWQDCIDRFPVEIPEVIKVI